MIPNIYAVPNELTSPKFGEMFASGCKGKILEEYKTGPWAGFGSPVLWDGMMRTIKDGFDFYYGDHAYFGRGKFYRITKNRLQHDGSGTSDLRRVKHFYEAATPWKKTGKNIIVCPQSESHHTRLGEKNWLERVLHTLKASTDRPIIVRKKRQSRPLVADLDDAWCIVTHTSNAAVESIMAGVPAICTGDCAASRLSLSDPFCVEKPYYPDDDRLMWAGVLADNQWTFDEIKIGKAWRKIR